MTDCKNLCDRLKDCATYGFKQEICKEAYEAIEELQAQNGELFERAVKAERNEVMLTGELEHLKKKLDELRENFVDYACSGITNLNPYCANKTQKCTDGRGWCIKENCKGFSPEYGEEGKA